MLRPAPHEVAEKFAAAGHLEVAIEVHHVVVHGGLAEAKARGDSLLAVTIKEQVQGLPRPRRQADFRHLVVHGQPAAEQRRQMRVTTRVLEEMPRQSDVFIAAQRFMGVEPARRLKYRFRSAFIGLQSLNGGGRGVEQRR